MLLACRDQAPTVDEVDDDPVSDDEPVDCASAIVPLVDLDGRVSDVLRVAGRAIVVSRARPAGEGAPVDLRIAAVDGCGLASRTLFTGLQSVLPAPRSNLPWLVTRSDAEHSNWLVDPVGDRPAYRLAANQRELAAWSARGAVMLAEPDDEMRRQLVELAMDETGRVRERTLHADVAAAAFPQQAIVSSNVAVKTKAGDVVVVDLESTDIETVAIDAESTWMLDDDARFFLLSSERARGGKAWVHDRITRANISLGRAEWTSVGWQTLPSVVEAVQGTGSSAPAETQLVLFPEMREVWWPAAGLHDTVIRGRDGTRVFVQDEIVLWLAPGGDDPRHLDLGVDPLATEHLELFAFDDEIVIAARAWPDERGVIFTRWFRPLPSGEGVIELFDQPVWGAFRVDGDRWAYFEGATDNQDWRGDLWLRDDSTGARTALGTNVRNQLASVNRRVEPPMRRAADNHLLFVEGGDDKYRSKLWLVRPELFD